MSAPVVLFAYARPDHLAQTILALSAADGARETDVWVFSDGPRNVAAEPKVAAVRALLAKPAWREAFASVTVIESPDNKGLARSIISGVTAVIKRSGAVIVLEDDLVVAPDFLVFMNAALTRHVHTREVGSVTGYSPLSRPPDGYAYDVYAVPRSCSHSWATWRDRWESVDWSVRDAQRLWSERNLRRRFESTGTDKLDRLRRQLEGKIDSWSILFNVWHVLDDRVALYPVRNLVRNIGFDGSGTHTGAHDRMFTEIGTSDRTLDPSLPPEDPRVLAAVSKVYSGGLAGRVRRKIVNHWLPAAVKSRRE